jgi:hypothetical protein
LAEKLLELDETGFIGAFWNRKGWGGDKDGRERLIARI